MRGKAWAEAKAPADERITPAYAGKSPLDTFGQLTQLGSPPPMRGKVLTFVKIVASARITPAYAGKRKFAFAPAVQIKDHPRLCGEKKVVDVIDRLVKGSPPPMRGKVEIRVVSVLFVGITPAYAGKRLNSRRVEVVD